MNIRQSLAFAIVLLSLVFSVIVAHTIYFKDEVSWNTEIINKCIQQHPQITTVIKTEKQIIVKPDSNLKNVIVVYSGNKSPITVKEEEFVSRTGISITTITPNDFEKFVTQY